MANGVTAGRRNDPSLRFPPKLTQGLFVLLQTLAWRSLHRHKRGKDEHMMSSGRTFIIFLLGLSYPQFHHYIMRTIAILLPPLTFHPIFLCYLKFNARGWHCKPASCGEVNPLSKLSCAVTLWYEDGVSRAERNAGVDDTPIFCTVSLRYEIMVQRMITTRSLKR